MSKVLNGYKGRYWCDVVKTDAGNTYIVDSGLVTKRNFETYVLRYDPEADKITSGTYSYRASYNTFDDMRAGHEKVCVNLERYLNGRS